MVEPMALVLYHSPFSTCSQKVRLCLAEKDLRFTTREVNLATQEHLAPDYLTINPNGVVPTLLDSGIPIVESSVICEYLDEIVPSPPLSPPDAAGRAQMRAWMRFLEEVPTAAIRVPSFNRVFGDALSEMSEDAFAALTERMPLRRNFYNEMGLQGFTDARVHESIGCLRQTLERADAAAAGDRWLCGAQFTIADILLIPTVVRMEDLGLEALWADLPAIADWYARAQARTSFAAAFYEGTRLSAAFGWTFGEAAGNAPVATGKLAFERQ